MLTTGRTAVVMTLVSGFVGSGITGVLLTTTGSVGGELVTTGLPGLLVTTTMDALVAGGVVNCLRTTTSSIQPSKFPNVRERVLALAQFKMSVLLVRKIS